MTDTPETPPEQETAGRINSESEIAEPQIVTLLDGELTQLKEELQEAKERHLRLLAESENMRKRLQKEKQEAAQYAARSCAAQFLLPLDSMEKALGFAENMSDEVRHWAIGFQMILGQFKDALEAQGIRPFDCKGAPFDPYLHEAVEVVETEEVPPEVVLEELAKGYKMGDWIIRPARVRVSKAKSAPEDLEV